VSATTVLGRIAEQVRVRVAEDRAREPRPEPMARKPADFAAAFAGKSPVGAHVIAEVKLASPSEGAIASKADPVTVAGEYLSAGARALSVLTERDQFGGSPAYLRSIREAHPSALLLMKDFMVDEYQFDCALRDGADAVLLIVALLGEEGTRRFLRSASERGLTALVEVHDEAELEIAGRVGARLIGVNNRDLKTLKISLEASSRLLPLAPAGATLIAESGLKTAADVTRLQSLGFSGFLIGTHFMKTGKPGQALAELLAGCRK
jgi:indole-3-glycerol phosphate synthase